MKLKRKIGAYIVKNNVFNTDVCNYIKYLYEDVSNLDQKNHKLILLSLLDNADGLVGLFVVNTKVINTYDRYGLRRYGVNIISISGTIDLLNNLDLSKLIEFSGSLFSDVKIDQKELTKKDIIFLQERH